MKENSKHLIISGRVQGVGFRYFTYRNAQKFQLTGWVQNLNDGTVETVLQGSSENIEQMLERLREGPPSARVHDIKEIDGNAGNNQYDEFSIRR